MSDMVNHPPHYTEGRDPAYETIKVIEAWNLNFRLGNCLRYISRVDRKVNTLEDLKKAAWYLAREISVREHALPVAIATPKPAQPAQPAQPTDRTHTVKFLNVVLDSTQSLFGPDASAKDVLQYIRHCINSVT